MENQIIQVKGYFSPVQRMLTKENSNLLVDKKSAKSRTILKNIFKSYPINVTFCEYKKFRIQKIETLLVRL